MPSHRTWIVGTKFGDNHLIRGAIPEGTPLMLEREPKNQYDANAISVWISQEELRKCGATVDMEKRHQPKLKLGMIPASKGPNFAAYLAPVLDAGGTVEIEYRRDDGGRGIRVTLRSAHLPEEGSVEGTE